MTTMAEPTDENVQLQTQPTHWSVDQFSDAVLKCGVYMAGVRHRGRAVVVAELALLYNQLTAITVSRLADLLRYYHSVPRKAATKNGMSLLIVGDTSRFDDAFRFLEQTLCHYHQVLSQVNLFCRPEMLTLFPLCVRITGSTSITSFCGIRMARSIQTSGRWLLDIR
jgi:hypothetical protein